MNIQKRPNGMWRARYRDEAGREHSRHFELKKDASKWLDEVKASMVTGTYVDPRAGEVKFKDYAEQWRQVQNHRPLTQATVERNLRLRINPYLGELPMKKIRHSVAKGFVTAVNKKYAANTARQAHSIARTICRAAVADRIIAHSPFEGITLPKVALKKKREVLTSTEIKAIIDAAPAHLKGLLKLAFGTGARRNELLGFGIEEFNELLKKAKIGQQLIVVPGQKPTLGPVKTEAGEREVPLPSFAVQGLKEHIAEFGTGEMGLIFTSQERKGKPHSISGFNKAWQQAVKKAGLPPVNFHFVRDCYASILNDAGIPFTTVQELLGHAPQGVTWSVYTHPTDGWEDAVRNALEIIWCEDGGESLADSVRTA